MRRAVVAGLLLSLAGLPGACERRMSPEDGTGGASDADGTGALFRDVSAESGVTLRWTNGATGERYLVETMVGGLGWIDIDSDGDQDLYVVNGHERPASADATGEVSNRILVNDGRGVFRDLTDAIGGDDRGYGFGIAVGDWDNDGDSDLFVANLGRDTLYRNDAGRLVDVTDAMGLGAESGWSSSAAFLDFDRDGDLDLYVVRYLRYRPGESLQCVEGGVTQYCHPRLYSGLADLLWRNDGDRFVEVGAQAGVAVASSRAGKGLGVFAFDVDRDGWIDVYVANDTTPNALWRNRGDGTFEDIATAAGVALGASALAEAGMGVEAGDLDGDGRTDLVVTNFSGETNALYLQVRDGLFAERSVASGLGPTRTPLGFGVGLLDFDLDGDADLVFANGHIDDRIEIHEPGTGRRYRQEPELWRNVGRGRFEPVGAEAGSLFTDRLVARGLALADIDGDGDVDIALSTLDRGVILLRNEAADASRAVTLRLRGTTSPRDAFGSRVEARIGERVQVHEHASARSYLAAAEARVTIGLGDAREIDTLTVHWPSDRRSVLERVPAGSRLVLEEPAAR